MKRIRSVIHYFTDTWQRQRRSKSRQFHRRCRIAAGGWVAPFPTPSPSWPRRHPFLSRRWQSSSSSTIRRFPLDLTARQKRRVSLFLERWQTFQGTAVVSTLLLLFCPLPLDSSSISSVCQYGRCFDPKRGKSPRLDLRMNMPSATEFITFIYTRVSNSYPSTTPDRRTVLVSTETQPACYTFSPFDPSDNEVSPRPSLPPTFVFVAPSRPTTSLSPFRATWSTRGSTYFHLGSVRASGAG